MSPRNLRDRLDSGEPLMGSWFSSGSLPMATVMARVGFDYLALDLEHSALNPADISNLLHAFAASDTPVLVRVPWNHPYHIAWALDHGAQGVIVPSVNTSQDARDMVQASRLPPLGTRSGVGEGQRDTTAVNRAIICVAMIETRQGVDNVDEIVAVPGVDGVFVAPGDLATAYSMDWQAATRVELAEHTALVEQILAACQRRDVPAAIMCYSLRAALQWRDKGFRMLNLLSDTRLAADGATRALQGFRAAPDSVLTAP
jgi:4-hydroxy-2-oxoheptanedioate aldolase